MSANDWTDKPLNDADRVEFRWADGTTRILDWDEYRECWTKDGKPFAWPTVLPICWRGVIRL